MSSLPPSEFVCCWCKTALVETGRVKDVPDIVGYEVMLGARQLVCPQCGARFALSGASSDRPATR